MIKENTTPVVSGYLAKNQDIDLFIHLMQGSNNHYWVFCNPLLEESIYVRPFYQELAHELHKRGDTVIQFDYSGCGESSGSFSATHFETIIEDIYVIIDYVKIKSPAAKIILFGMRIGANFAFKVANKENYSCLCWLPITDGKRFCDDLLLSNMAVQMSNFQNVSEDKEQLKQNLDNGQSINVMGYQIEDDLFHDFESITANDFNIDLGNKNNIYLYINQSPANKEVIQLIKNKQLKANIVKIRPFWHEPKIYPERQEELLQAVNLLIPES